MVLWSENPASNLEELFLAVRKNETGGILFTLTRRYELFLNELIPNVKIPIYLVGFT
jgi:hypothetical protein